MTVLRRQGTRKLHWTQVRRSMLRAGGLGSCHRWEDYLGPVVAVENMVITILHDPRQYRSGKLDSVAITRGRVFVEHEILHGGFS